MSIEPKAAMIGEMKNRFKSNRQIRYAEQSTSFIDAARVAKSVLSKSIAIGPQNESLVLKINNLLNTEYCTLVSSGTAALHAAYAAIPNVQNSEVITTPISFLATATTAIHVGAKVRFADIDLKTGLLDVDNSLSLISPDTSTICVVDYAGIPFDVEELKRKSQVEYIIQDAAHSFGSLLNGEYVGSKADMTTFSFFATKNITSAEGGAVTTNNHSLHTYIDKFKSNGIVRDQSLFELPLEGPWHQESHILGLNYRMSELQAALAISQLRKIEKFKMRRSEIHSKYRSNLTMVPEITFLSVPDAVDPMWHLFPIFVPSNSRRRLFEYLYSKNIFVQVNYRPIYLHPLFQDLGYRPGLCPNAESFYAQEISLPIHNNLKNWQIDYICELIIDFFKN